MGDGVESPAKVKVDDTQCSPLIHIPAYSAPEARYTSQFLQIDETLATTFCSGVRYGQFEVQTVFAKSGVGNRQISSSSCTEVDDDLK